MKRNNPKICDVTHKISLSEAAANRRAERYDDIQRVYYCKHCDSWHLTKRELGDWVKEEQHKDITQEEIKNRYNELIKKLKNDERRTS